MIFLQYGFRVNINEKGQSYIISYKDAKNISMQQVFKYIKADQFFKDYCPQIKSYKHKIRGKNGRGNPLGFSYTEQKEIKKALRKLFKEISK